MKIYAFCQKKYIQMFEKKKKKYYNKIKKLKGVNYG